MNQELNARMLALRAETEALVDQRNAAWAAIAPANSEVDRLTAELNAKVREMDQRHKAEEAELLATYDRLVRQAMQQVQQAQASWAQQQQAQAQQQAHDQQMRQRSERLAAEERERAAVAQWRARNGAA